MQAAWTFQEREPRRETEEKAHGDVGREGREACEEHDLRAVAHHCRIQSGEPAPVPRVGCKAKQGL